MGEKKSGPSYIAPDLWPLVVPIATLTADPKNARKHGERNKVAIRASLDKPGQRTPIVVSPDGTILKGNGTYGEALALGWTHIARSVYHGDRKTLTEYKLADNRSGELAEWEPDVLFEELRWLEEQDVALEDLGWTPGELEAMAADPSARDGAPQMAGLEYRVIVDCKDEAHQAAVLADLESRGLPCRPLIS
jgi:hypothetical protein